MPRSARKESGCGIYQVMMRGVNRQAIFDDDEDCRRFMDILADLPLMNHFHLLVMEKDWKISWRSKTYGSRFRVQEFEN